MSVGSGDVSGVLASGHCQGSSQHNSSVPLYPFPNETKPPGKGSEEGSTAGIPLGANETVIVVN